MKCSNCGADLKEGEKYCSKCGKEVKNNKGKGLNNQRRKSHAGLIAAVFTLFIIAFISIVVVIGAKTDKKTPNYDNNDIENNSEKTDKNTEPTTLEFKGYTFTIPSNVTASVSGEQLFVYGPGSKWVGVVMTQEGKYETLISMKDQIKTALSAQEGADSYNMDNAITEEKEYGGKPFLVTRNIGSATYDLDITYGKADDNNIYVISITKSDSTELTEAERTEMYTIVASGQKAS